MDNSDSLRYHLMIYIIAHTYMYNCTCDLICKTPHNDALFENPYSCIRVFHVPKALFYTLVQGASFSLT